jgi:branched-chain amino acid transport system ATP-binding protein
LLKLENVSTWYGPIRALEEVSLEVADGVMAAVLGANGAGKTTLMNTISGLMHPREGRIEFSGVRIDHARSDKIVRLGVVQVPEGRQLFPDLTVAENLRMGAYVRRDRAGTKDDQAWVFARFPVLKDRVRQLAGTLSGGEQQMLAIGRALMARPRLLLLDEPSLGLSPILVRQLFDTIGGLNRDGTTILVAEQNAHIALATSTCGFVLETGRLALEGRCEELRGDVRVRKLYLGGK